MTQRHYSPQQIGSLNHSLEKETARKLREAGSTNNLLGGKTTASFAQDTQSIGHYLYRKKDQIGSGYTSHVYKCRSAKDDNQYAIKVIQLKKYSVSSLEMLDNEIQILKKLNHPNILKYENVYRTATNCYLVTELCSHGDLLEYMTKHGKLCQKQATAIIAEVIEAAKHLFRMGVVHRDIKPANIFKGNKNWKLGDFGFAINTTVQTKTKHNVGTPLYMPLEALLRNSYSPQSDIFSIGVILYQMIVGITPWQCKSEKELIRKLSTTPFIVPEKYKLSSHLKYLLTKMCAVNKQQRMTRDQFLEININNFVSLINFNETNRSEELKRKGRLFSVSKLNRKSTSKVKPAQNQYLTVRKKSINNQQKSAPKVQVRKVSQNKPTQIKTNMGASKKSSRSNSSDRRFQTKLQQKNYQVLVSQLNFCRFMYYLIENSIYLQLNTLNRGRLSLLLFKHVLKIIKQLSDNKNNWFGFTNWDNFRKSSKYQNTYKALKQYCQKYQKQYLVFLKKAEINVIKEINQKLPEFSTNQQFSIAFYRKILSFLSPFLRQCNQNLASANPQIRQGRGEQGVARLQALKSLYKYYRLVEMCIRQYQNYTHFSSFCEIIILKNYRQSQISSSEYLQIKQQIKMI